MNKPKIANIKPAAIELKAGEKYFWCACGHSSNQPLCDGSHKGTKFTPLAFVAAEDTTAYLCQCKHTANPPYCDGSHKRFSAGDIGTEA